MASSAPRPNTQGSPPLSRSTRSPPRARSIRRLLISACVADGFPPRLPANSSRACGPAIASTRRSTSASWTTTLACASPASASSVNNPGSPGPAPVTQTWPGARMGMLSRSDARLSQLFIESPRRDGACPAHYRQGHGSAGSPTAPPLDHRYLCHGCSESLLYGAADGSLSGSGGSHLAAGPAPVLCARRDAAG